MEDIVSLGVAGIYSLLILSLCFSFLLAIRLRQLEKKLVNYENTMDKELKTIIRRIEVLESVVMK